MSESDPTRPEASRELPPPPAPPGAPASSPKRLYRDPRGVIGGVASGLAAYFDIDPVIVRLLWIVALLTGVGFPAYLVCWVAIPKAPSWPPPGHAQPAASGGTRAGSLASGLVIVALAALIGKGVDGLGDWLLPAALIGFGIYLLNQRDAPTGSPGGATAPPPYPEAAPEGSAAAGEAGFAPAAGRSTPEPVSIVTPTVLSLLALAAGVCWALHAAGVVHFSIASLAAGGLVVVAVGLLASLWLGRARGLIPAGLALASVMLVATAVEPWVERAQAFRAGVFEQFDPTGVAQLPHSVGDRHYQPLTLDELEPRYEHGIGKLKLDLTRIDFSGTTRDVHIELGVGELDVIVPAATQLEARGRVGLGEARALDHHAEGMGSTVEVTDVAQGQGTLRLDFNIGIGEGTVSRAH